MSFALNVKGSDTGRNGHTGPTARPRSSSRHATSAKPPAVKTGSSISLDRVPIGFKKSCDELRRHVTTRPRLTGRLVHGSYLWGKMQLDGTVHVGYYEKGEYTVAWQKWPKDQWRMPKPQCILYPDDSIEFNPGHSLQTLNAFLGYRFGVFVKDTRLRDASRGLVYYIGGCAPIKARQIRLYANGRVKILTKNEELVVDKERKKVVFDRLNHAKKLFKIRAKLGIVDLPTKETPRIGLHKAYEELMKVKENDVKSFEVFQRIARSSSYYDLPATMPAMIQKIDRWIDYHRRNMLLEAGIARYE